MNTLMCIKFTIYLWLENVGHPIVLNTEGGRNFVKPHPKMLQFLALYMKELPRKV